MKILLYPLFLFLTVFAYVNVKAEPYNACRFIGATGTCGIGNLGDGTAQYDTTSGMSDIWAHSSGEVSPPNIICPEEQPRITASNTCDWSTGTPTQSRRCYWHRYNNDTDPGGSTCPNAANGAAGGFERRCSPGYIFQDDGSNAIQPSTCVSGSCPAGFTENEWGVCVEDPSEPPATCDITPGLYMPASYNDDDLSTFQFCHENCIFKFTGVDQVCKDTKCWSKFKNSGDVCIQEGDPQPVPEEPVVEAPPVVPTPMEPIADNFVCDDGNIFCVTAEPEKQNCGYFNGDYVCIGNIPDNTCVSTPNGSVMCTGFGFEQPTNSDGSPASGESLEVRDSVEDGTSGGTDSIFATRFDPIGSTDLDGIGGNDPIIIPSSVTGGTQASCGGLGQPSCPTNPDDEPETYELDDFSAPGDPALPQQDLNISFSSYDAGFPAGTCPADVDVSLGFGSVTIPFAIICAYALKIRPIVIAAAYLSAILIVLGGARRV